MDQNQHGQPTRNIGSPAPTNPPTKTIGSSIPKTIGPSIPSSYPIEQQYAPQYIHPPQQLQQQLINLWAKQCQEIEEITEFTFRTHSVPLARIKKIMKTDEDVKMISAETPVVFAKACELFILELTLKAWNNIEGNKKSILKKSDIVSAISRTDVFDFLVDNVIPRNGTMVVPYYYMPPYQHVAGPTNVPRIPLGSPVLDQNHHELQTHTFPTTMGHTSNQQNHLPNLDD